MARSEFERFVLGLTRRPFCRHAGEEGDYCGRCGADLRPVAGYQCRVCDLRMKSKTYPPGDVPDFCTVCGAPRFTFMKIKKKTRSSKS
ncbi:MAG: hypothetical protein ABIH66_04125 [bacterium]